MCGYDPRPWLPVLSGVTIGDRAQSERFIWDLRRTLSDQHLVHAATMRQWANAHGMECSQEGYGINPVDLVQYQKEIGVPMYEGYDLVSSDRFVQETDDPDWIVRWVQRDRELRATPIAAVPEQHLTVTLDQLIDGLDRVVLDLALVDGKVTQALARTPTWDGPGINFYQPGTLHTRPGKALYHSVDASGLKLGAEGLSGPVKLTLKPPQSDTLITMTTEISAKRHALLW